MLAIRKRKRVSAIKRIRGGFGRHVEREILVFCSGRNIHVQIINLKSGATEFSICTCDKNDRKNHKNIKMATELGKKLAVECKKRKISNISFNRAEKIFHGVVKAVADGFYKE